MYQTMLGLREGALTLTYNAYLVARGVSRWLTRPTQVGVRILVPRNDRLLLVRHRGGRTPWSLPGGGVDRGETLAGAAGREAREEAGLTVRPEYLLGVYHSFAEGFTNYTAVFVCTPLDEATPPIGDLEIVDARFFLLRDLPATIDAGSLRRIADYTAGRRGVTGPW